MAHAQMLSCLLPVEGRAHDASMRLMARHDDWRVAGRFAASDAMLYSWPIIRLPSPAEVSPRRITRLWPLGRLSRCLARRAPWRLCFGKMIRSVARQHAKPWARARSGWQIARDERAR